MARTVKHEAIHTSDDAVLFNFCCTIMVILVFGLLGASIFGISDARAKTSSKKAQDLQLQIEAWQDNLGEQFTNGFAFEVAR